MNEHFIIFLKTFRICIIASLLVGSNSFLMNGRTYTSPTCLSLPWEPCRLRDQISREISSNSGVNTFHPDHVSVLLAYFNMISQLFPAVTLWKNISVAIIFVVFVWWPSCSASATTHPFKINWNFSKLHALRYSTTLSGWVRLQLRKRYGWDECKTYDTEGNVTLRIPFSA